MAMTKLGWQLNKLMMQSSSVHKSLIFWKIFHLLHLPSILLRGKRTDLRHLSLTGLPESGKMLR